MNELIDVLSVWWIKVLIDLMIVYCFVRVSADNKNKTDIYSSNIKISEKLIP